MHEQCPFPLAFPETTAGGEGRGEDGRLASLRLLMLLLTCWDVTVLLLVFFPDIIEHACDKLDLRLALHQIPQILS